MAGKNRAIALHKELLYTTIAIDHLHQNVENGLPAERFHANCREFFTDPVTFAGVTTNNDPHRKSTPGHFST